MCMPNTYAMLARIYAMLATVKAKPINKKIISKISETYNDVGCNVGLTLYQKLRRRRSRACNKLL